MSLDASTRIGRFIPIDTDAGLRRAYLPVELPFAPGLQLGPELQALLRQAHSNLGRMDGAGAVLPRRDLFIRNYLFKEAALTSQIEGTVTTFEELQNFELAPKQGQSELQEAVNHIRATYIAVDEFKRGRSLDLELILQLHEVLLRSGRGSQRQPGRLRTQQNYVVGTEPYIPPPPEAVHRLMENLVQYIAQANEENGLLVTALAHVQFETIHPFMDGNGRLGRMLITLILCRAGILRWPLLFPSLYLKQNRSEYFDLMTMVREHGDWESWLAFFLRGIIGAASAATAGAEAISQRLLDDRALIAAKLRGNALVAYESLLQYPQTSIEVLAANSGFSWPTTRNIVEGFVNLGICREITGAKRNRVYRYDTYLDLLNAGLETAAT